MSAHRTHSTNHAHGANKLNYDEEAHDKAERLLWKAEEEARKNRATLAKYNSDQTALLQLQSTLPRKVLVWRGVPLATLRDVNPEESSFFLQVGGHPACGKRSPARLLLTSFDCIIILLFKKVCGRKGFF